MLPWTFIYRAHQRHQAVVSGPLVDKVPQGAHNAHKGKSAPLQPGFVSHTITDRSVCKFWGDYTVSALIVVGRFCGAVWAPHPTLPTNRAGGYYPPLRSIGYKNALVGAAICRPPCSPDCFSQICNHANLEQLVVGSSPVQKNKKNGAHKAVYHFGWTSRLRNLLRNSPPDCFFQICLRQIWSSLSLVRVNK